MEVDKFYDDCRAGNIAKVEKALKSDYARFLNKNWAVKFAIRNKHLDIVHLLMQDHPQVESSWPDVKQKIFSMAAENGHKDVVELLLQDSRVDSSARNNEAIKLASENGYRDVVELLEQHQYKIDNVQYSKLAAKLK